MLSLLLPLLFYMCIVVSVVYLHNTQCSAAFLNYGEKKKRSLLSKIILQDDVHDDIPKKKQQRNKRFRHDRLDMARHFDMCRRTKGFQRRCHMKESSFWQLVQILKDHITIDAAQS